MNSFWAALENVDESVPVGLPLVVHVVVAHVHVDHSVLCVGPHHRVVAAVPDLVRLGAGAERKAGRVDRQQHLDVAIALEGRSASDTIRSALT